MKKIYRSEENTMLGGVFGGVGDYFNIDPTIIRIVAILITLVTGFVPMALVYLLAVLVIPIHPTHAGVRIHDVEETTEE